MEWPMKRRYAEFSGEKHSTGALFGSNFHRYSSEKPEMHFTVQSKWAMLNEH